MNALEYLASRDALAKLAEPCPCWGAVPYNPDAWRAMTSPRHSRPRPVPVRNDVRTRINREDLTMGLSALLVVVALAFLAGVKWAEHCAANGIQ